MIKIPLTRGMFAIIDNEDYNIISLFKWYALQRREYYYAATRININGHRMHLSMHRLLINAEPNDYTDHWNGNTLDNRKNNIRKCTPMQNTYNRKSHRASSSQFKGVCWHKGQEQWVARITCNGKPKHIGSFDVEKDAARAYNEAAIELHGEYARLNKI